MVITWRILEKYWSRDLADDTEQVRNDIRDFLEDVKEKMVENLRDSAYDIFSAMSTKKLKA